MKKFAAFVLAFMFVAGLLALALVSGVCTSCGSLQRTCLVGGGAGGGAAIGSLAGPVGAIGGAVIGGAVSSAVVESDVSQKRADTLENRLIQTPAPKQPFALPSVPWWIWLVALWIFLKRAHLLDVITGKLPRFDALLRTLGLRTHYTRIPLSTSGLPTSAKGA